jgi:hypothetical protein
MGIPCADLGEGGSRDEKQGGIARNDDFRIRGRLGIAACGSEHGEH